MCLCCEVDLWIECGWVFVNGEQILELGLCIDVDVEIVIMKEVEKDQVKQVIILFNKLIGYVFGQLEVDCKLVVMLIIVESWVCQGGGLEFKLWMLCGLVLVGWFDIDFIGLLVFMQDGCIVKKLIGEDSQVEKEYFVWVSGEMVLGGLKLMQYGFELDGKLFKLVWVK